MFVSKLVKNSETESLACHFNYCLPMTVSMSISAVTMTVPTTMTMSITTMTITTVAMPSQGPPRPILTSVMVMHCSLSHHG